MTRLCTYGAEHLVRVVRSVANSADLPAAPSFTTLGELLFPILGGVKPNSSISSSRTSSLGAAHPGSSDGKVPGRHKGVPRRCPMASVLNFWSPDLRKGRDALAAPDAL